MYQRFQGQAIAPVFDLEMVSAGVHVADSCVKRLLGLPLALAQFQLLEGEGPSEPGAGRLAGAAQDPL
jgi:hypothetical protein